jgi:hypothetical protein
LEAYGTYDFVLSSKKTPFGDWSESKSRRTYVYLIEALNISFPDYDFSGMDPNSFERASVLERIISSINGQLSEMNGVEAREPMLMNELNVAIERLMEQKSTSPPGLKQPESKKGDPKHAEAKKDKEEDANATSKPTELLRLVQRGVSLQFTDSLWAIIDQCIGLSECEVFALPSTEEDEGPWSTNALWSFAIFFVNLKRHRVVFFTCSARSILSSASLVLNGPSESPTASASPSEEPSYASSLQHSDQPSSVRLGIAAGPRTGLNAAPGLFLPTTTASTSSISVAATPSAGTMAPPLPRPNRSRANSLQGLDDLAALTSAGGTLGAREALGSLEGQEDEPFDCEFRNDSEDEEQLDDDFEEEDEEDESESLPPDSPKRSLNSHKRGKNDFSLQLSPMEQRKKRKT